MGPSSSECWCNFKKKERRGGKHAQTFQRRLRVLLPLQHSLTCFPLQSTTPCLQKNNRMVRSQNPVMHFNLMMVRMIQQVLTRPLLTVSRCGELTLINRDDSLFFLFLPHLGGYGWPVNVYCSAQTLVFSFKVLVLCISLWAIPVTSVTATKRHGNCMMRMITWNVS